MRSSTIFAPLFATSAFAATHLITVGFNKSIIFEPAATTAAVGDKVEFTFTAGNHSVVSSAFSTPCTPATGSALIYSGFLGAHGSNFTVDIASTTPIYFYCSQAKHCQAGMVGAINAPASGDTLDAYKTAAKAAANNVTPAGAAVGGTVAQDASSSNSSSSASGTATTAAGTGSATRSATGSAAPAATTSKASGAERIGAYAGGVFAGALAVAGLLL